MPSEDQVAARRRRRRESTYGWGRSGPATSRPMVKVTGVGRHAHRDYCARCGQKKRACVCG